MKKSIFTLVLLCAGVAFASAQTAKAAKKVTDEAKTAKVAVATEVRAEAMDATKAQVEKRAISADSKAMMQRANKQEATAELRAREADRAAKESAK